MYKGKHEKPRYDPDMLQKTSGVFSGSLMLKKGVNNLWADDGNTIRIDYVADSKLYIDSAIAELQATVLENLGG